MLTEETGSLPDPISWLAAVLRGECPVWPFGCELADIERVMKVAQAEGVNGLLLAGLSRYVDPGALPATLLSALHRRIQRESAVEISREIELERVFKILAQAGLSPLIMKGTALAYTLYSAPHLRSRCDTDLLFPDRASADQAWTVLQQTGYRRSNAVSGEFISQEFACYRTDGLKCELRAQFRTVKIRHYVSLISPHPTLWQSNRLIWLYDIHLLAGHFTPADWAIYADTAIRLGLSSICLDGLLITQRRFSTVIPEGIMDALRSGASTDWLTPGLLASKAGNLYAGFRALPDWRSRMRLLRESLFPDARYMLEKYQNAHSWRFPLLYLQRIFTGILKQIR